MKTNLNKSSRKLTLTRETLTPLQANLLVEVVTVVFLASAMTGAIVSHLACH